MSETGVHDCDGRMICVGDTIVCNDPIFIEPKTFVVRLDPKTGLHNIPVSFLRESCRVVNTSDENNLQKGIHSSNP